MLKLLKMLKVKYQKILSSSLLRLSLLPVEVVGHERDVDQQSDPFAGDKEQQVETNVHDVLRKDQLEKNTKNSVQLFFFHLKSENQLSH